MDEMKQCAVPVAGVVVVVAGAGAGSDDGKALKEELAWLAGRL